MKRFIPFLILFISISICILGYSQSTIPQGLFKNQSEHISILSKPGDYINNELNKEYLIIRNGFSEQVFSPVDGTISRMFYIKNNSLESNIVFDIDSNNDIKNKEQILKNNDIYNLSNLNDLSLLIQIKTKSNLTYTVSGLGLANKFKTGFKIKKGELIGYVNYFYFNVIKEPCIALSLSRGGKPLNPLTLSKVKIPKEYAPSLFSGAKNKLIKEDAIADLKILKVALEEGYPGLYDYHTKIEIDNLFSSANIELRNSLSKFEFYKKVFVIINNLKDSHISILNFQKFIDESRTAKNKYAPSVYFGWIKDTAYVTRTTPTSSDYLNRKIQFIDRIPQDSVRRFLMNYVGNSDGNISSYKELLLLIFGTHRYFDYFPETSQYRNLELIFENGDTVLFDGYRVDKNVCIPKKPRWRDFYFFPKTKIETKIINNNTAYLALGSFDLFETEKLTISRYFKSIDSLKINNLIIDIRNNGGGEKDNISFLLNYIQDSTYKLEHFSKVNNYKSFSFLKYAENIHPDNFTPFKDYYKSNSGYIKYSNESFEPNKTSNFAGKVYILCSERTKSAAAIFAGFVKRNKLGVVVGRESGSTFHQLNAEKFVNLILPNSKIKIRFPLVKIVYDSISQRDSNFGRGVLPDYQVDMTLDELSMVNGDAILNTAKELIKNGKYFPKVQIVENNSNHEIEHNITLKQILVSLYFGLFLAVMFVSFYRKFYKKKNSH